MISVGYKNKGNTYRIQYISMCEEVVRGYCWLAPLDVMNTDKFFSIPVPLSEFHKQLYFTHSIHLIPLE